MITGNCGVGFAPCRPGERKILVKLMEGVEDIPEIVMDKGLPWSWETFPEFLDVVAGRRFDVDLGIQAPHSPIRVYVMGERGAAREPATPQDIEAMGDITAEAVRAGAFGVTTSRALNHRTRAGELSPSFDAAAAELEGLARGLKKAGGGVFQMITLGTAEAPEEFALMRRIVEAGGRPLSFTLLAGADGNDKWRQYLRLLEDSQPSAAQIRGQVFARPVGVLHGLELAYHPFSLHPSYRPLEGLPLAQKVAAMRDPALRARLLAETAQDTNPNLVHQVNPAHPFYSLGDPPNYFPTPEHELGRVAEQRGISKLEALYDALLENEGRAILMRPAANFPDNRTGPLRELMNHPATVLALGDGGAHYGSICDASYATHVLTRWVRDAEDGERFPLAWAVRELSARPAEMMGLDDRGVIAMGRKADLNVIDLERLELRAPHVVYDLPAGGRRLRQKARGYVATVVAGQVTYRDGEPTGALPGRLIRRGQTSLPMAAE